MKPLTIHEEASEDIEEAAAYYEKQVARLGQDLLDEVGRALNRILADPGLCPPHGRTGCRKCFVEQFLYTIFFKELPDRIWVAAVAHGSRKPNYWLNRSPDDPSTQTLPSSPSPDDL